MGLIRTLLIIAVFYYGFKFLGKLFAPYLQRYAANKMQEKFNQQFNANKSKQEVKREPEGKTSIYTKPKEKNKINTDNTGDYIDYEEVD